MEGQGKTDRHRSASAIKIFKTAVIILFIAFVAASFIYVVHGLFDVPRVNITHVSGNRLSNVGNVRYLKESNMLAWDAVKNATCYVVEINGKQFTVQECQWLCPDEPNVDFIRVKAVDASGRRGDSGWSYCDVSSFN